jgi:hypothetical protein
MDPIQAPDPEALQMAMALMGGGPGQQQAQQQGMGSQMQMNQLQQLAQSPLQNGQNASLGMPGGSSLGTPQDMYAAMMMQAPGVGY